MYENDSDPREGAELKQRCDAVIKKCFPPSSGKEAQYLFQYFTRYLCDSHLCTDDTIKLLSKLPMKDENIEFLYHLYAIFILIVCVPFVIWNFCLKDRNITTHEHFD